MDAPYPRYERRRRLLTSSRRPARAPFCTSFCIICPMQHNLAFKVEPRHMTETQPPILTDWPHPPSFLERQRGSMTDYDRL